MDQHATPDGAVPRKATAYDPMEIVGLMTGIYELLVKARYIDASAVKYPPHDPAIDVELCRSLGMEPLLIEILQQLPYVEGKGSEDEFYNTGGFADFRDKDALTQSRDPQHRSPNGDFDDEKGEYVRPWVLVLNQCGNHGSTIFFDTRNGHIICEQQLGGSGDIGLHRTRGHLFDNTSKNQNSIEYLPSRPARQFFRDLYLCIHTLAWIPWEMNYVTDNDWERDQRRDLELLYRTYGWPDNFDSHGWDIAAERYKEYVRVSRIVKERGKKVKERTKSVKSMKMFYQQLKARRVKGIWDNNPDMDADQVAKLNQNLDFFPSHIENNERQLEEAERAYKTMGSHNVEMTKAWKEHLVGQRKWVQSNLVWARGEGRERCTEVDIQRSEAKVLIFDKMIEDANQLPKTAWDAINPDCTHRVEPLKF